MNYLVNFQPLQLVFSGQFSTGVNSIVERMWVGGGVGGIRINNLIRASLSNFLYSGLSAVLGLAGCQQEGDAEKAGKNLDRSIENDEQKIEETKEKVEKKLDDPL